jgi:undecaprenyl diphosphate synthase
LFVRTSGEQRTSNFLPWQSAYAEMVFLPTLWPDMTRVQLWEAIEEYQQRTRRFGSAVDLPSRHGEGSR